MADLDELTLSVIKECLPSPPFEITEANDEDGPAVPPKQVDLIIVGAGESATQVEELCAGLRSRIRPNVPLMACVGRHTFPLIRPLLGNALQSIAIWPFDAKHFRR